MKRKTYVIDLLAVCIGIVLWGCGSQKDTTAAKQPTQQAAVKQHRLSDADARKLHYFFLEATNKKAKQDYAGAFELYQHCLDIDPHSAATLGELASFYFVLGQEDKGVDALKTAVREDGQNFWYQMQLGNYYQQRGKWLEAIAVYENMTENFPKRLEPLMSLSMLYQQNKQPELAISTLNRIEELDGKSEQLSMQKFAIFLQNGKAKEAYKEIEGLIAEYPYDLRYQTILGDAYLQNNQPEEAHRIYQRILKEEPAYAPALVSMANYYQQTHQDSLYRRQIDTLLLNNDVDGDLKQKIMLNLILQSEKGDKDSTRMAGLMSRVLERPQTNADLAMLCAQYLTSKNMKKEAIPVLDKVLELDPSNKPARLQLLSYALSEQDNDKVIRIATPALQYNADAMEFYYYLGMAYFMKDEKEKALEIFQKGVGNVKPDTDKSIVSDFFAIMGDILHEKGKTAEAYAAYDSSLVYNPNNIGTLNNYAYFLSEEKSHLDKAEEMSYRTVKAEPENATYLDTYAWILFEKGKFTEARIYIEQALKNNGDKSSVIVEHAGDIYYHLNNKEKALEMWKQAETVEKNRDPKATPRPEKEMNLLRRKITTTKYVNQ